jgi:hypothetical protein
MERDREIAKLINVLGRIARAASHANWSRDADAARFCVHQYNKVLARVSELEPAVAALFTPLPESGSADVARIAAHELMAYFEDEAPEASAGARGVRVRVHGCGGRRAWVGRVRVGSCS